MLYFRLSLTLILLFLAGCSLLSPKAEYIPSNEKLSDAIVGKPYFFKINILGERVLGSEKGKAGFVTPNDAGIFLRNCRLPDSVITKDTRDTKDHNCVEVYGIPTKTGTIKINIGGGMHGNMSAPTSFFSKDYTFEVAKP